MTRTIREGIEIDGVTWTVIRVPMEMDTSGAGSFVGIEFRSEGKARQVKFSPFRLPSVAVFKGMNAAKLKALLALANEPDE